ncbi:MULTISPECIES: alpha-galactosidase [unclassified Gilliamella]|uniref:alpha-galactosidase n=1 Tax=unclassified Gilliamella TaxID=2685620 RepID=UPI00226A51CC|nr:MULTISPECIES: alpha-galactosidase [unclassified Gilliamella]MCX8641595.1 alpha-galactosidase [Gilliamella sp. B3835]MCX8706810.1 alpha-galactosidase [Gilliamella sp. B3783]MCX8708668.1 alpha-galactosidase [Gilliamella sp. B3780]MCX8713801.1 alpha-galactosidase [Gilliamella sp. B3781]MCX8715586.1 alpha-galactosidase [Gilliamella sp. B3784]
MNYHLGNNNLDIILRTQPYAEICYFGKRLQNLNINSIDMLNPAIPNSRLDIDVPFTLCPEEGLGNFSTPGLEGHRNGKDWSPVFITKEVKKNNNNITIISEDDIAKLRLTSQLILDESGVLQCQNSLTNLAEQPYQVNRLSVTLPIPERAQELMAFNGRWIKEFFPHRTKIEHCGYLQENRRGRTSHEYFPGMIVGTSGFKEQTGEVWGIHLGWSGNHRIQVAVKSNGKRFIQAEALYLAGEISLAKGETVSTPWLYATYSDQGLNKMSQHFHQFLRTNIIKFSAHKPRPVHLNTWEGIFFDHNPDYIMKMATQAAQIGVERFIIDDGWFGHRDDDYQGLGDWYLDERKYPNGLEPVIKHVKDLGMEFGIWVEPEMINKNSNLYRAHPDWLLELQGYQQPEGRHQYVLDLQNPNVFDYLLERLTWLLGSYDIDYIKWDMNREIVQAGHNGHPAIVGQTKAVYRLLDILQKKFPNVEIESCSSGGGRIDYEILKRTQRFWASDSNDALDRQIIQRGMSYFFPPEVIGAHIGGALCHTTYRQIDMNLRGLTALFGHMGVELDPVKESQQEKLSFANYIKLHKQLRSLLHSGNFIRLDVDDNQAMQSYGVVSQDQTEAAFIIAQLILPTYALSGNLRLAGLLPDKDYHIEILDMPNNIDPKVNGHVMKALPNWMVKSTTLSGDWLMNIGLPLPVLDPATAMLIKITSV